MGGESRTVRNWSRLPSKTMTSTPGFRPRRDRVLARSLVLRTCLGTRAPFGALILPCGFHERRAVLAAPHLDVPGTDTSCSSCGTTDGTVRVRPWHDLDVLLCARCHASLTGDRVDPRAFTVAWALLVAGLLLAAAGAAAYVLTR